MNEGKPPVVRAKTTMREPRSVVDMNQEMELRAEIGDTERPFNANEVIETMAPGADKGRLGEEDEDEKIVPLKTPGDETGISAGA